MQSTMAAVAAIGQRRAELQYAWGSQRRRASSGRRKNFSARQFSPIDVFSMSDFQDDDHECRIGDVVDDTVHTHPDAEHIVVAGEFARACGEWIVRER